MSYPNVPLGRHEQDRRISQAVNHLLNQVTYYTFTIEGVQSAGQEIIYLEFPLPVELVRDACVLQLRNGVGVAPTADVTITFTSNEVPAFTRFLVTAPNPQDATFSDFIISLAVSE